MSRLARLALAAFAVVVGAAPELLAQRAIGTVNDRKPDALIDLRTEDGVRAVRGAWKHSDAHVVGIDARLPGPDLKPTGGPVRTFDLEPKAGVAGFDDRSWPVIPATTLEARRSTGRLAFSWYRIRVTVPERVAALQTTGSTVVLEVVVDDYAEVWVDGKLPRTFGQSGGAFARGWNTPNRVVLTRDARPGQEIQVAILGANGPFSDPPPNFIWVRSATLEFFAPPGEAAGVPLEVERLDEGLDAVLPANARVEKLADGFDFVEGPVWVPEGYLLFSDPNRNTIYRYTPGEGVAVFRTKSGYTGADVGRYHQPGSNGLTLDSEGRLTIDEHGNRRVTRIEPNGLVTVLADRFDGKRLNSPNDLVYHSSGALYFTDPPFGLPAVYDDPAKELPFSGVFRLHEGALTLLTADLKGPNGLAFSPDERYLYVGNWDPERKVVMRYEVLANGTLAGSTVFLDLTRAEGDEAIDGVKVDQQGHVYVSGPGGLWIVSPEGRRLGVLRTPELAANFAWGDADGRTLYLTARTGLYRVRLNLPGVRPGARRLHTQR
jgi:gluconolactonase